MQIIILHGSHGPQDPSFACSGDMMSGSTHSLRHKFIFPLFANHLVFSGTSFYYLSYRNYVIFYRSMQSQDGSRGTNGHNLRVTDQISSVPNWYQQVLELFLGVILTSLSLVSSHHMRIYCKYCKSKYRNIANLVVKGTLSYSSYQSVITARL